MIRTRLVGALRAHGGRPLKHGIVAGLVVALLAAGTGASYAYWSVSATATSTPTIAKLVVTPTGFGTISLGNENVSAAGSTSLVQTSSVQIKNDTVTSSVQAMPLSVRFSSSETSGLAAAAVVRAWPVASLAACTTATAVPAGTASATWAAGVTVTASDLDAGVSAFYCIRTTVDRASATAANGALSFTPRAAATLTAGSAFTVTTTATSTGSTTRIYPTATSISNSYWQKVVVNSMCLDVSNSGTGSGTAVIPWSDCHGGTNQQWQFIPDSTNPGYVEIKPRNATALRIDNNGTLTSGTGVTVTTDGSVAADRQLWQVQVVNGGSSYQIVSKYSGMCLTAPGGSGGQMTQAPCAGGATQTFAITQLTRVQFPTPTCSIPTGRQSLVFAWSEAGTGPYTIQGWTGSMWYTADSSSNANATQLTVPNRSYPNGTYAFRILDGTDVVVATGTVVVNNGGFSSCTAQAAVAS
ncbi:hypothetical protein GCM10027515_31570 [Schumannella luteola]|uniref:Ricin B lectin domain-containing protein n=1 Tax=Schumannella luteola TaxID=472059 RepID=A0A852YB21_9MICO|nr:RICIN domain-containing protein [Schumannella luteola]NYG99042.1 hypothetical protein [Schumannella luteola]TPX06397.1 hypothetical protein FJ656_01835 [Schumannella luteola]